MPKPVPVKVPVEVRWRDLDALGHVNNAVYITYLEHARLGYIRAVSGDAPPVDQRTPLPREFQFILAEVTCKFRSPARLGDHLVVTLWVSHVGRKSFVFEYRIEEEPTERLIAEASSTQVWYDYEAGESRVVPAEMIARMENLQSAPIARL